MPVPTRIKALLTLWFVGETLIFILIVHLIGVGGAILLGLATSVLGVSLLKRAGASAIQTLRRRLDRGGAPQGVLLDDTLASIGAIALLLPGFLSDIVGLALAVPPIRTAVAAAIARRGGLKTQKSSTARHGPAAIDLDPEEWRHNDPTQQAMPKG